MKKIALAAFSLLLAANAVAQQNRNLNELGCATITTPQEIQRVYDFVKLPAAQMKTTAGGVDSIPLAIHIVGKDNGTGYYNLDNLFNVLCQLNQRFAPVDFFFYIKWPIQYIDNSAYYEHDYSSGYQMMAGNNVQDAVNVYFVNDPAGACGYYTYGADAVAIKKDCATSGSTTLTHELGHYFGLPHTFYGWEYGTPANPEKVTRGAGANCSTAGDGFCDTWADFLATRWSCPYGGNMVDQNNEKYHLDSSIYMSYSMDACMSRFSPQQIAEMQYDLHNYRTTLLGQYHAPYAQMDVPQVIYPTDSMHANFKKVRWHKVPGAEYYHVKVYPSAVSSWVVFEGLTTDTTIQITTALNVYGNYTARIAPLMNSNVCRTKTGTQDFVYTSTNSPLGIGSAGSTASMIQVQPNPVKDGIIRLRFSELAAASYQLRLVGIDGSVLLQKQLFLSGTATTELPAERLPAGMYFLQLAGPGQLMVEKVMVQ